MRRALLASLLTLLAGAAAAADKTVLLIAGPPSHGPGEHEHNAGVQLFAQCLAQVPNLKTRVARSGWPADAAALEGVDAIVIYSDGGRRHPALGDHLAVLAPMMARGVGFGLLHYAVEPTATEGQPEFLRWAGGAFEVNWSVNPSWDAAIETLPKHDVTRGVHPFHVKDEWYFHLRFPEGMKGITPLLVAVPGPDTTSRPDGPHEGNPAMRAAVAAREPQTLAWVLERPDGGRGFGFTGGHSHRNWGHDDFRKIVLNAIVWLARLDVPKDGVACSVTEDDLTRDLDPKPAPRPKPTETAAPPTTAPPTETQ